MTVEEVPMSKNTYSDQVNSSYLYTNKLFYGKEGIDEMTEGETTTERRFTNLVPIVREAFELAEKELTKCEEEVRRAKEENEKLKIQVQEARENVEAEFKKVEQAQNEAREAKDGLTKCKKDAEKMKEEAEQAKSEEALRCKTEKAKLEELMQCEIDMAKAETEWYKKVAEECKKEKESGIDEPITDKEGEIDTGEPVTDEGEDENGEITSREITSDCLKQENCGPYTHFYKVNNKIGCQGFSASDLLKELYPEMYSNSKIVPYIEKGAYSAVNFKFAFTEDLNSISWFGNIECKKCVDDQIELACQEEEIKSFCYPNVYHSNPELNKSFFSRGACPNLFREPSETSVVKAKQVAPLIIVNNAGNMIDKEGNNTQVHYNLLKPYLELNGKIKDCGGNDQKCKDYNAIMEKVAWNSDKEVLLKTAVNNTQEANPYYYGNEDNSTSVEFGSI